MNRWVMEAGALLLVAAVAAGWHYRSSIMAIINPPASAARPMERPDVLYTWVDKDGVTHYSQDPGQGTRVVYDGSGITPMAPVEGKLLEKLSAKEAGTDGHRGSQSLHDIRREMQENQMKMQQAKDEAMGL